MFVELCHYHCYPVLEHFNIPEVTPNILGISCEYHPRQPLIALPVCVVISRVLHKRSDAVHPFGLAALTPRRGLDSVSGMLLWAGL